MKKERFAVRGKGWQFLKLEGSQVLIDDTRYYLDNIVRLLDVFVAITRCYV